MPRKPKAKYELHADDRTDRGLRSAQFRLRAFSSFVGNVAAKAVGAVAAKLQEWVTGIGRAVTGMNELRGVAADLGQSLEEAASVRLFAELQDADPGQVNAAIERLKIRIGELVKEEATAVELFQELGLSAEELQKRSGLGALLLTGSRIEQLSAGRRQKVRDELLGGGTGRLFQGDYIGSAQRAGVLGLTQGLGEQSRNADAIEDAFTEAGALMGDALNRRLLEGLGGEISVRFADAVRQMAQFLFERDRERAGTITRGETELLEELRALRRAQESSTQARYGR